MFIENALLIQCDMHRERQCMYSLQYALAAEREHIFGKMREGIPPPTLPGKCTSG